MRPGEVGIEITADGRFFRLYDDGASGLILASGGEEEGTWKVIDTTAMNGPGVYQLDFTITGTFPGTATFLQQPTHFRFISFPTADYQPWDGEPPTPPVPPVSEPPPATPNPPPTTDGSLPPTGANSVTVWLALTLLACGIGLSVASRRGHRSRPETSLRPSG